VHGGRRKKRWKTPFRRSLAILRCYSSCSRRRHVNKVMQGTFGVIQGTFGVIQGTFENS
jgi:hypothetical protein